MRFVEVIFEELLFAEVEESRSRLKLHSEKACSPYLRITCSIPWRFTCDYLKMESCWLVHGNI